MISITDRVAAVTDALSQRQWPIASCAHLEPGMTRLYFCIDHPDVGAVCAACWANHLGEPNRPEHGDTCIACGRSSSRAVEPSNVPISALGLRTPAGLEPFWAGDLVVFLEPNVCQRCWAG